MVLVPLAAILWRIHAEEDALLALATTGIMPFMNLIGQVMSRPEHDNAPRVFVIVDNGSTTAARPPSTGWPRPTRTRS
jgi:hypothetical protein